MIGYNLAPRLTVVKETMPILANAKKALRVSKRKAAINAPIRSKMKTKVKKFRLSPSEDRVAETFSAIDRAAKKNLIHQNKAARLKSQLTNLLSKK